MKVQSIVTTHKLAKILKMPRIYLESVLTKENLIYTLKLKHNR